MLLEQWYCDCVRLLFFCRCHLFVCIKSGGIIDAKDRDLSRFKARGGKIVMYFGWADTALNPLMGIDYYEKGNGRFGPETTNLFRLFWFLKWPIPMAESARIDATLSPSR